MTLKGFFKECHEKQVFKMLSIYIVSSWLILQVLAVIVQPLNLPEKSVTYLILILLFGFPVYIYYVWKFRLLKFEKEMTDDPTTPYNKSAFQKMYFFSLSIISIISISSAALIINNNFNNNFKLKKFNSNDKIAVLEFENNTGDKNLDIIGKMTANWITHGITENKIAQVISPKIVNDYTNVIESQSTKVDINSLLKTYFKPSKIIEGVYYKQNDKLLLQGSIKDGLTNETLFSFETIKCNPNSPLDCVEKLKQKILGYLTIENNQNGYIFKKDKEMVSYYEETPPKFEAYQYLINANDNYNNQELFIDLINKAIEVDSNYFEPKIHKISYYYNKGDLKIADSLLQIISLNSKLSIRQRNYLLFYKSMINGNNDKAYRAIKKEYDLAYLDMATNMTTMTIALQYVNRPEDIEAIYNKISMDNIILENCSRCGFRYYLKGLADIELGKYSEVINLLLPITNIIEANYLKRPLISAYIKSQDYATFDKYIKDLELTTSQDDLAQLLLFSGKQMLMVNQKDKANFCFDKVITLKTKLTNKAIVANAYFLKEDYVNAQKYFKELYNTHLDNIDYLVHLSISNFEIGNFTEGKKLILSLDKLRTNYQFGEVDYAWAKYYKSIGNKDKSLESLLKAVSQGYNFTPITFQNDPYFKAYKDTPQFKKIMKYWNKTL
jgi:hypothetical protein